MWQATREMASHLFVHERTPPRVETHCGGDERRAIAVVEYVDEGCSVTRYLEAPKSGVADGLCMS